MDRRGGRVNHTIQRELGILIAEELNDPRLSPMTSVTNVDVNRDLSIAKVYVTVLGGQMRNVKILSSRYRSTVVSVGVATTVFGNYLVDQLVHVGACLQLIV